VLNLLIHFCTLDSAVFQKIEAMESFGDYGNKIQTLIRHLLYIQQTDPGAKSIVFSAWADSLTSMSFCTFVIRIFVTFLPVLQRALTENSACDLDKE